MSERNLVTTFREVSRNRREFNEAIDGVADAVKNLKPLIGEPNAEARGSQLISVGIAMIALPEPTLVTDVVGSALVAAGLIKDRMKPTTVADISREVQGIIKKLGNITQELTH